MGRATIEQLARRVIALLNQECVETAADVAMKSPGEVGEIVALSGDRDVVMRDDAQSVVNLDTRVALRIGQGVAPNVRDHRMGCHGAKNALRSVVRRVIAVVAPDTMMRGAVIHHNNSNHRAGDLHQGNQRLTSGESGGIGGNAGGRHPSATTHWPAFRVPRADRLRSAWAGPPSAACAVRAASRLASATITASGSTGHQTSFRRPPIHQWANPLREVQYEKRSFGYDLQTCPSCGRKMQLLAVILERAAIRKILAHLRLPSEPPTTAPARASPEPELPFDHVA